MNRRKLNYFKFAITYYLLAIIPLTLVFITTLVNQTEYLDQKLFSTVTEQCSREADYWTQQMRIVKSSVTNCKFNRIYYPEYSSSSLKFYLDIIDDLEEMEGDFPFADGIYLIRMEDQQVFTSKGIYKDPVQLEDFHRTEADVFGNEMPGIYAYRAGQIRADAASPGIVLVSPVEIGGGNRSRQYLIFTIAEESFASQFSIQALSEENATQIYFGDELIYEENTLGSPNRSCRTYEADLGSGFRVVHSIPDTFRITNLFAYLRSFLISVVIALAVGVLLSRWFSRNRYGVFQDMLESKVSLEDERNSLRKENCLYEILNRKIEKGDQLWHRCLENQIWIDRRYLFFILLPSDSTNSRMRNWLERRTDDKKHTSMVYGIPLYDGMTVYMVCSDADKSYLEGKMTAIRTIGGAGISDLCSDVSLLREAYRQARKNYHSLMGNKKLYPEEEMQALMEAVDMGDPTRSEVLLDNILDLLPETDSQVIVRLMTDLTALTEADLNLMFDRANGSVTVDLRDFQSSVKQALHRKIRQHPELFQTEETADDETQNEPVKVRRNIMDVLLYIQDHYLEEDFSIKQMAAEFDTTASNLSHFFKKQKGISLAQYIERIKVEKARELLQKKDLKIVEISSMLGYRSSTVFIEVFKRQEGITPGAYRKQMQTSDP